MVVVDLLSEDGGRVVNSKEFRDIIRGEHQRTTNTNLLDLVDGRLLLVVEREYLTVDTDEIVEDGLLEYDGTEPVRFTHGIEG